MRLSPECGPHVRRTKGSPIGGAPRLWHLRLLSAPRPHFIFGEDFNPVMKITAIDPERDLRWRCVSGHEPWADNDFRFQLESRGEHGTKLRSWQEYAVELDDDYYDNYNFNWGYYLESLRLYCDMGTGKPYPAAD
jgi:hypothetical protein